MRTLVNDYRADDKRQIVKIESGSTVITESEILQSGFSFSSQMLEGSAFQVGTAIADEIVIRIDNSEGIYSRDYVGVEFDVSIAMGDRDTATWDYYGTYVVVDVDETYSNQATIKLQDKFCIFDTVIPALTVGNVYGNMQTLAQDLGVTLNLTQAEITYLSAIPLYSTVTNMTYRDFFRFCGGLMLENCYITGDTVSYKIWNETNVRITPSERYSSALQEPVYIGGLYVTDANGNTIYSYGSTIEGQRIELSTASNQLIDFMGGASVFATFLQSHVPPGRSIIGKRYYPLTMATFIYPELETGDVITYVDKEGNEYLSVITSLAWIMNGSSSFTSSGDSKQRQFQYIGKLTDENKYVLQQATKASQEVGDLSEEVGDLSDDVSDLSDTVSDMASDIDDARRVATNYLTFQPSTGLDVGYVGTNAKTRIDGSGVSIYDDSGDIRAQFKEVTILGNPDQSHAEIDFNSFRLIDKEGSEYAFIGDLRDSSGEFELVETFTGDGSTTRFYLTRTIESATSVTVNGTATTAYIRGNYSTYGYILFNSAPADGAEIVVTYISNQPSFAFTFGNRTGDTGIFSSALGDRVEASGYASHAEGRDTTASGDYSHAEGMETLASGSYGSHAEGRDTTASGSYGSHAEGVYTEASGDYGSHAEGDVTTASGDYGSHAEGRGTEASGRCSHAEGMETLASGSYGSHAEGRDTTASGSYGSHAEGWGTTASGAMSHAQNYGTIAAGPNQTALGTYNVSDTTSALIIGNGSSDSNRSNILKMDWNGNITGTLNFLSNIKSRSVYADVPNLDLTQLDNGISANYYSGFYVRDYENRYAGFLEYTEYPDGRVQANFGARNYTSATNYVTGRIQITVAKNGATTYNVSEPASFRSAIGALSTTGGNMTDNIYQTSSVLDLTQSNNGLSSVINRYYALRDKDDRFAAYLGVNANTNGDTYVQIMARNYSSASAYTTGGITIAQSKAGATTYTVTAPGNFRSAISAASTSTATTSANGLMSSADKSKLDGITAQASRLRRVTVTSSAISSIAASASGTVTLTPTAVSGYTVIGVVLAYASNANIVIAQTNTASGGSAISVRYWNRSSSALSNVTISASILMASNAVIA